MAGALEMKTINLILITGETALFGLTAYLYYFI